MAKIIKMTDEHISQIKNEFSEALNKMKLSDGKITYTKNLGAVERKAELKFTELAYLKMITLVREFDKEVAWHGIAKRGDNAEKDEYIISDIMVYPQEVTGATVNTDQEKYQMWLMQHDDEIFNNIRMQGHSHVNMGTSPSSVDTSLYDRILEQLEDDMFYIFLIWNKRNERTIKIYDLAKNVLFETTDVTVSTINDGTGIEKFLKDAKEMVQDKKYTPVATQKATPGSGNNTAYANSSAKQEKKAEPKKEPEKKESGKKKRKMKSSGKKNTNYGYGGYGNYYDNDDWDDYGNWYRQAYGARY